MVAPLSFEHGDLLPQSEDFKRGFRATLRKKTRMAARNALIKWSTNQLL